MQVRQNRFDLVGAADQFDLFVGLRLKHLAHAPLRRQFEDALVGADGVGVLVGDLAGELEGFGARVVADASREAVFVGFDAGEDAGGVGEFADHVLAGEMAHQREARHVGHQTPFGFHDRKLRIGRGVADVGAEHDLEAAAEGDTVDRGDDRHRNVPPDHRGVLRAVGIAVAAFAQRAAGGAFAGGARPVGHLAEVRSVEPGAERAALARQDNGTQTFFGLQPFAGGEDGIELRGVERVHLLGPVEADVGDAVFDLYGDAIFAHQKFPPSIVIFWPLA